MDKAKNEQGIYGQEFHKAPGSGSRPESQMSNRSGAGGGSGFGGGSDVRKSPDKINFVLLQITLTSPHFRFPTMQNKHVHLEILLA